MFPNQFICLGNVKKEEFETYNEEEGQFGYLGNPKKLNFQSTASN